MTRITDTSVAVCYLESIINQVQIPKFRLKSVLYFLFTYMMTIKKWIELKFLSLFSQKTSLIICGLASNFCKLEYVCR